jgi:hypothetical protein
MLFALVAFMLIPAMLDAGVDRYASEEADLAGAGRLRMAIQWPFANTTILLTSLERRIRCQFIERSVSGGFILGVAVSAVLEIVSALGFRELVEDTSTEFP